MVLALKDTADFPIPTKNLTDTDTNFNYNTTGSINAYDRTYLDIINANRTFFFPPDKVLVERSTDGGSTWTTVDTSTYTTQQRGNLLCGVGASLNIGTGNASTSQMLRVTLLYPGTAWYCSLDRAYIRWSIAGHSNTAKIQASTYGAQSTYTDITGDIPISGWSGDNMIKFSRRTAWGTNSSAHLYNIRFVFKYSSVNSSYISSQANVIKIAMFGMDFWGTTGTPRYAGHLYNWDYLQNVTFPAKVTSTNFTAPRFTATGSTYPHVAGNGSLLTLSGTGGWASGAGCLVLESTTLRPGGNDAGSINLGTGSSKWKNLYLSGNISNGTYSYTLPSATGTLALTSNIPTSFSDLTGTVATSQIADNAVTSTKIDHTTVDAETIFYTYTQPSASSSEESIDIPVDFSLYKKITIQWAYEPSATSTRVWRAMFALNSSKNIIATKQRGYEFSPNWATISRDGPNGGEIVAYGAATNENTSAKVEIFSPTAANYLSYHANSFNGADDPWFQVFNGRILASGNDTKYIRVNWATPRAGGWIQASGIPR